MKKIILFFLLLAGTGNALHAQWDLPDPSENLFNNPKTSKGDVVFTFFITPHTRMILHLSYISQVDGLPDLDSLLQAAIKILEPFQDSLRADGMVRRVDIVMRNGLPKIRFLTHPELSNSYTIKDNELMQLKVNQDTVRLITQAHSKLQTSVVINGVRGKHTISTPVSITFITDNVSDLAKLEPGQLKACMAALRPKIAPYNKDNRYSPNAINYRAAFNMKMNGKMVNPNNVSLAWNGQPVLGLNLAPTFAFARGYFAAGLQVGLDVNLTRSYGNREKLRIFSEIQAFFPRDPVTNKVTTEINRFVGVQLIQFIRPPGDKLELAACLGLSYLTNKNSTVYEKNTFRLSLPILSSRHFTIEPQLMFNDFFKNASPSIRLLFNF